MSVFEEYSQCYDLLYKDKDYRAEAQYVHVLIKRYALGTRTILEFGSGTGVHAYWLTQEQYVLHGIERSGQMVEMARTRTPGACFIVGDIRETRLAKRFDSVLALFHVLSYQTTNRALETTFANARAHINLGGLFIFDCWYGPSVISLRPSVRVKRFEDDNVRVARIAEPELRLRDSTVDVCYQVLVEDKRDNRLRTIRETHRLRYLFEPEVLALCERTGFSVLSAEEWMTGQPPSDKTWSVVFVLKAN